MIFRTFATLAILAAPSFADIQIVTNYVAEGQNAQTTIWSNGSRMRYDYGSGVVMLRYCDQSKMVQIDDAGKSYTVLPVQPADKPNTALKSQLTDTGERQDIFGHQARHLRIVETTEGKKERTETDGWYFDLASLGPCFAANGGTSDRGYPASYTITTYAEDGKVVSTVNMKMTAMTEAPIASTLLDLPAGYKDATPKAVPTNGSPKPAGVTRVGAVLIHDRSNSNTHNQASYNRLASQLMEAKLDLIQLDDGPQDAIVRKAQETGCDYVLYTDLASVGKPASGKVTGLLHKAPGLGKVTGGEGMEAKLDYRLVPGGGGEPVLASTAVGRAGTSVNIKEAAMLASTLVPMAMAARMFSGALNPAMMNTMLSGRGYGPAMVTGDPMMGGITSLISLALQPSAQGNNNPHTAEAVAAAIDMEAKSVISQLRPAAQ